MATPPIIANTDFNQWQNWQQVRTPDGSTTYYVVPGYDGRYVFDPFASDATGQITIYDNPQSTYDAAQKVKDQQEAATGNAAQIAQIGGQIAGAAGTYLVTDAVKNGGASILGNLLGGSGAAAEAAPAVPNIVGANFIGAETAGTNAAMAPSLINPVTAAIVAALAGIQQGKVGYDMGKGKGLGSALKEQASKPTSYLMPTRFIGAALGSAFGGGRYKAERNKWDDLLKTDEFKDLPAELVPDIYRGGSRTFDEMQRNDLAADHVGFDSSGQWVNNKFNQSRDVADLRPEDIWGYSAFGEKFGKEYYLTSEENRRKIAQKALDDNLIKEHHGTIDIKDSDELKGYWEGLMGRGEAPTEAAPAAQPQAVAVAPAPSGLGKSQPAWQGVMPNIQQGDQSSEEVKQLFADMINGNVRKGVGGQPNVYT